MAKTKNIAPSIVLIGEKETKDYFKVQKETDVWQSCYTNELEVKGLTNAPIMLEMLKTDLGMTHVSDESVLSCMESHKLIIGYPTATKRVFFPIRDTAFKPLSERAGIGGRTLSCTEDKRTQREMSPETKALIFNEGLQCYTNKSLVLVRDNAISAVLSGDENDYSRMPVLDLIEVLEDALIEVVGEFELRKASCDYEIAKVTYEIIDKDMTKEILDVFRFITRGNTCKIYVQLVTSDVGICGANLFPIIEFEEGKQILLGNGLKTLHKGVNAMDKFKLHSQQLYANFIENARKIAELKKVRVKYAGGCARNIACASKFPKKESLSALGRLDQMGNCTAFDVYIAMYDIIDEYYANRESSGKPLSEKELIDLQEKASEVAYVDFRKHDFPFEWRD